MDEIMKKIPVKIVEITSPSNQKAVEVMLDVYDYYNVKGDTYKKIKDFRQSYFEKVRRARDIMPKDRSSRKASHFWKIGRLLYEFNKSIKNEFEITNYNHAIMRDFGLYDKSHIGHTIQFGEFFNKKDIVDSIPMSTYLELVRKANTLKKSGLFEKEKKRLLKMSEDKNLPPHKKYREELNHITKLLKKKESPIAKKIFTTKRV